ncbi:hypothetical protein BDZ91DRAFT_762400 [Kalaharituber pfeilii]|nr:hypothetical protein BDZ91DRAFT_762400 [Kalaharituber pfeilii]
MVGMASAFCKRKYFDEKGVNISVDYSKLPRDAVLKIRASYNNLPWTTLEPPKRRLTGLCSRTKHGVAPLQPKSTLTSNANLNPLTLDEDVIHFHRTIKEACDRHDKDDSPKFKKRRKCSQNKHRKEVLITPDDNQIRQINIANPAPARKLTSFTVPVAA